MILLVLFAFLIGVPILELYVIIQVGSSVGFLPTIGLMILTSLAGAWLLRFEGTRAWRAYLTATAERRPPHREAVNGVLVMLGGVLMLVPGFVSDALGLLCLLPPTRWPLREWLLRQARRPDGIAVIRVRSHRQPPPGEYPRGSGRDTGRTVEGELGNRPPEHPPPRGPSGEDRREDGTEQG